jgi:hypothetical protein
MTQRSQAKAKTRFVTICRRSSHGAMRGHGTTASSKADAFTEARLQLTDCPPLGLSLNASAHSRVHRCVDQRASQISSRRSSCYSPGRHLRRSGENTARTRNSTKTGSRSNSRTSTAYNTWLDSSNHCHTQSCKAPLHIRPEKLLRRLRKGSTAAMLGCDAWISLSCSSDIPLS